MEELWQPVYGYEGLYEVSSLGRVRSLDRKIKHVRSKSGYCIRRGMLLNLQLDSYGYVVVSMCREGQEKTRKVHRLVAEAFHGPAAGEAVTVDHINNDTLDNRPENLRWLSFSDNRWKDQRM